MISDINDCENTLFGKEEKQRFIKLENKNENEKLIIRIVNKSNLNLPKNKTYENMKKIINRPIMIEK